MNVVFLTDVFLILSYKITIGPQAFEAKSATVIP